jgi:ribosomal protein S27E
MSDSDREHEHEGSFAGGQSTLPHPAAHDVPGSFSEGQEASHAEHLRMGSFADTSCPGCQEVERTHAEHVRKGSFADTSCPKCQAMG